MAIRRFIVGIERHDCTAVQQTEKVSFSGSRSMDKYGLTTDLVVCN
jgi:hypothetical protein